MLKFEKFVKTCTRSQHTRIWEPASSADITTLQATEEYRLPHLDTLISVQGRT